MPTFDAYQKCPVCHNGIYWKDEQIGEQTIKTPVRCEYCNGHGEILASKLRPKPLYDRQGRPIDQQGRILKNPQQEPWYRQKRRREAEKDGA